MTSDIIQKHLAEHTEQSFKRLQEISMLVLLITVAFFVYYLCSFSASLPFRLNLPNGYWIFLRYFIFVTVVSFAFFIGIVSHFWWLRNKPHFHVLFIQWKKNQEQIDATYYPGSFTLVLISIIGITTGLSSFVLVDFSLVILRLPAYYHQHLETDLNGFYLHPAIYSLIIGVCFSLLLYLVYSIKTERTQRSFHLLLFIPIFLLISAAVLQLWYSVLDLCYPIFNNNMLSVGYVAFTRSVLSFSPITLFLASFIVLSYLAYHIHAEYRKFYTFVEEKNTRGVIEEGVWILPKKVRAGDTHSLFLDLTLSSDFKKRPHGDCSYNSSDYLEAEVQAIGLNVRGEERLRISETSLLPVTTWVYSFAKSGINTINLKINVVKPADNSRDTIVIHTHKVKVHSFLSISLSPMLALITPILVLLLQTLLRK